MAVNFANIDTVLLSFLENKYQIQKNTPLYSAAEMLLQRLWQGSVCVSLENLNKITGFDKKCLDNSKAVKVIGKDAGKNCEVRPLIFDGENLYIQKYYVYQTRILEKIKELLDNKKIHIITGGPGTGKTTSLAGVLKNRLNEKILLAAPTGKAALRMKESLAKQGIDLEAKTIHRLLGNKHLSASFKHSKDHLLDANIIAIDECSMVDLPMMSKLLEAVPSGNDLSNSYCDLYLLGDRHQLASVEAGSVFADICRMFEGFKTDERVYRELTVNYRAKEAPGTMALSEQILNAENPVENFDNENVHYFTKPDNELFGMYKALFSAEDETAALEFLKKFQILCATKAGSNGTESINKRLCETAKKENARFTPVIITENSYRQDLFNGDVGVKDSEWAYFYMGKTIKAFPVLTLPKHEYAFAITIHKSQGSEYECVAVVYPNRETENNDTILTKELLYTAITRAKRECFIFGSKDVLINSCKKEIYRASGIG